MSPLGLVLLAVVVVNLPFGWWREGLRKFSFLWLVAVHAPVPLVAGLRLAAGLPWQPTTFPLFLGAYFLGQFLGARLRRVSLRSRKAPSPAAPPRHE